MSVKKKTPIQEFNQFIPVSNEVKKLKPIWDRLDALFENNEKDLESYCKRFPNESSETFKTRQGFYTRQFINPAPDMVNAKVNAVANKGAKVELDPNSMLSDFDKNVSLGKINEDFKTFRKKYVLPDLQRYGAVCLVVDKPNIEVKSKIEERKSALPYVEMIRLQNIINYEIKDNEFVWFAYSVCKRDDWVDPENVPEEIEYTYVWTKEELKIYQGNKLKESKPHDFGFVPIVIGTMQKSNPNDLFGVTSMFQTSSMIYSMNDHISKLNTDVFKSNSKVLWSEDATSNINTEVDEGGNVKTKTRDNDGVIEYGGDKPPEYLKIDIDIQQRLEMVSLYKTAAIENEKMNSTVSKMGAKGQEVAQSGYAKVLDREPLKASLIALAMTEKEIVDSVFLMVANMLDNGNKSIIRENEKRVYEPNIDYDLKPLEAKLEEIKKWIDIGIYEYNYEITKVMLKNIVPNLTDNKEEIEKIIDEIEIYGEGDLNKIAMSLVDEDEKEIKKTVAQQ